MSGISGLTIHCRGPLAGWGRLLIDATGLQAEVRRRLSSVAAAEGKTGSESDGGTGRLMPD